MPVYYQTIVVGLGAAGVTAAVTLAKAGLRVLALEAQDRIGGRIHTLPFGDGVTELGAEWIHGSESNRIYDTAVANGTTILEHELSLGLYHSDGRKRDQVYQAISKSLVHYVLQLAGKPSHTPESLGSYVERKLLNHIRNHRPELLNEQQLIADVLDFSRQSMNIYNASDDWNNIDAQSKFVEVGGHQHLSWHKLGYGTFFNIMLNNGAGYPTLHIKRNTEVLLIEWPQDPISKVLVICRTGDMYTANNVIVTVSLGVLKERHTTLFKPKLPDEKIKAIETIAMGVMNKIQLAFHNVWWPTDDTTFGFVWKEDDKKTIAKEDLWMTKVCAASRTMGAGNVLTFWTSGEVGKLIETLPIDEVRTKCQQILQRFMGDRVKITVPEPTLIARSKWYANSFTRGSYSYDCKAASKYPTLRADLARPLTDSGGKPRVLFAGEATHDTHFSTVHGAADTGYKVAMYLISSKSKCTCKKNNKKQNFDEDADILKKQVIM